MVDAEFRQNIFTMATSTFSVPNDRLGAVIGTRGIVRRAVELSFGVDVQVNSEDGVVTVKGATQAAVDAAINQVRVFAKPDFHAKTTTPIPDLMRGAILGRGGASIRTLQAVTGCRISIPPSDNTGTTVITIEGAEDGAVHAAAAKIQGIIASENIRLAQRDGKSPACVTRKIAVPAAANVGAIAGA
jgi:polyribonucleotide nucleotidyltransferase